MPAKLTAAEMAALSAEDPTISARPEDVCGRRGGAGNGSGAIRRPPYLFQRPDGLKAVRWLGS